MVNLQDYITKSRLFKTFRVDDLLFVAYQCLMSDDRSEIWTHHNYFAYVTGGKKKWKTQQGEYLATGGDALFVKKGANTVYQYFEEQFLVLFIFLPDNFIQATLAKYPAITKRTEYSSASGDTVIPIELNEVLETYFQSVLSYFPQQRPPQKDLLKLKLEELILNIFFQPDNHTLKKYFLRLGRSQETGLMEVIEANFASPLSLEDYARLCARSLSTFRRDFKKAYHTTPGKWLLEKRLGYSRFLLETTDKTVNEVIAESGFKNRSHFIKAFRDRFGITPKRFQLHQADV